MKIMAPSPTERDELFKSFARALFAGDIDALYQVAAPDFLWRFHDGLAVTKSLADPAAIAGHLAYLYGYGLGPDMEALDAVEKNARRLGLLPAQS